MELGLVVGFLISWSVRKARRAGKRIDKTVDIALDAALDHLDQVVRRKLGNHSALTDLDEDAQSKDVMKKRDQKQAESAIPSATRKQLELALERASQRDPGFKKQLTECVTRINGLGGVTTSTGGQTTILTADVSGSFARSYQAGRDLHQK